MSGGTGASREGTSADVPGIPIVLNIRNISSNSGVYVAAQNIMHGLSTHSKTNTGFGSTGSRSRVQGNIAFVYDPDVIDTPIDDRDVHMVQYRNQHPNIANVGFQSVNVATAMQNAGVFIGQTHMTGWDTHQKINYGQGPQYGEGNQFLWNSSFTYDPDNLDTWINDQDVKTGLFYGD